MKPLDFVRTPKGQIALITETNGGGHTASIVFIGGDQCGERNAWWRAEELRVVDSLPRLLADCTLHPMGMGREDAHAAFPLP